VEGGTKEMSETVFMSLKWGKQEKGCSRMEKLGWLMS